VFDHVVIVEPIPRVRLLYDETNTVRNASQDEHCGEGVHRRGVADLVVVAIRLLPDPVRMYKQRRQSGYRLHLLTTRVLVVGLG